MKGRSLATSALVLALGGLTAKLLGAFYRIPLTALLGGEGMGIYQLVFPVYTFLLVLSSGGIPSAIAHLGAEALREGNVARAQGIFLSARRGLLLFGALGTLAMALLAVPLASLQGNLDAALSYVFLSPSVFLVCFIASVRGRFQAEMNMFPTAISQVLEQLIKTVFGLLLVSLFLPSLPRAAAAACFAVTMSEGGALLFLCLRAKGKNQFKNAEKVSFRTVFQTAFPIAIAACLTPFSHLLDSLLVINLLDAPVSVATAEYGILSGPVHSLIALPVGLAGGIATSALAAISSSSEGARTEKIALSFKLTLAVSLPCAVALFLLSENVVAFLYGGFSLSERTLMTGLIRISSVGIFILSMVQTASATLQAVKKSRVPVVALALSLLVKSAVEVFLLRAGKIGIFGVAISELACYFVALAVNLVYIIKEVQRAPDHKKLRLCLAIICCAVVIAVLANLPLRSENLTLFLAGGCGFLAYGLALLGLGVFTKEELPFLARFLKIKEKR